MRRAHDTLGGDQVPVFKVTDAIGYSNPANLACDFWAALRLDAFRHSTQVKARH